VTADAPQGDAPGLEAALASVGLVCAVEGRGRLALLIPRRDAATQARLADPALRRRALALAAEHGFTHAAVELRDGPADAPRPAEGGEALRRD
jgi:hypothetical protein